MEGKYSWLNFKVFVKIKERKQMRKKTNEKEKTRHLLELPEL